LGDTFEQCKKKYGRIVVEYKHKGIQKASYIEGRIQVSCYFYKGRCVWIKFDHSGRWDKDKCQKVINETIHKDSITEQTDLAIVIYNPKTYDKIKKLKELLKKRKVGRRQ